MNNRLIAFTRAALIALFSTLMMIAPTHADVKCSCRTIKADGEGNTSCSTSESGGRCTIDYNLFGAREDRAADVLQRILDSEFTSYRGLNTHDALLQAAKRNELPKQVLLYMLVATVDQFTSFEDTVPTSSIGDIQSLINNHQQEIITAFSPAHQQHFANMNPKNLGDSSHIVMDNGELVISYGCISAHVSQLSVMFKAWWSPARLSPQCRLD